MVVSFVLSMKYAHFWLYFPYSASYLAPVRSFIQFSYLYSLISILYILSYLCSIYYIRLYTCLYIYICLYMYYLIRLTCLLCIIQSFIQLSIYILYVMSSFYLYSLSVCSICIFFLYMFYIYSFI